MKTTKLFTSKSVVLAGTLAIATGMFSAMPAQADSITFDASPKTGDPAKVNITLDDTTNPGKITVKVDVITDADNPNTADISGVYFNVPSGVNPNSLSIAGDQVSLVDQDGSANDLGNGVNMSGGGKPSSFSVGVRIGVSGGINGGDDYQTTTFTLSGASLSDFTSQAFGVRLKSVGLPEGPREGSSKLEQSSPATVATSTDGGGSTVGADSTGGEDTADGGGSTDAGGDGGGDIMVSATAPEPLTIAGTILGGGALLGLRKRKGHKKAS